MWTTSTPVELDELVQLYQRTSTHLSYVRTYHDEAAADRPPDPLVADANGVIYGRRARTLRAVGASYR